MIVVSHHRPKCEVYRLPLSNKRNINKIDINLQVSPVHTARLAMVQRYRLSWPKMSGQADH